jgi:SAM-dependent methyltransferase
MGKANLLKQALGDIAADRALDVATGRGASIRVLKRYLKNYIDIVGVDNYEKAIKAAKPYGKENTWFLQMNAEYLGFREQSFDLVNVSKSLHHFANAPQVLKEMKRVLKHGGRFVISETHRDGQTEAQLTTIYLHHWIARVDSALGLVHNRTLSRQEIVDLVEALELSNLVFYDRNKADSDPMRATTIRRYERYYIGPYLQRAEKTANCEALRQQGEELLRRLYNVGIQSAEPLLVIVGEK